MSTPEPQPELSKANKPPHWSNSDTVLSATNPPRVILLESSPYRDLSYPKDGEQIRAEYLAEQLNHEIVLRLLGPLNLHEGEVVELQWKSSESHVQESLLSKCPMHLNLPPGRSYDFRLKASRNPRREGVGDNRRYHPDVKIIHCRLIEPEKE